MEDIKWIEGFYQDGIVYKVITIDVSKRKIISPTQKFYLNEPEVDKPINSSYIDISLLPISSSELLNAAMVEGTEIKFYAIVDFPFERIK